MNECFKSRFILILYQTKNSACCVNKRAYTMYGKDGGNLHDGVGRYSIYMLSQNLCLTQSSSLQLNAESVSS